MKTEVKRRDDEEFRDYPINDLVEGWFFRIREISFGAYRVEGVDRWGRVVSREGSDDELDDLLIKCANDAREITDKLIVKGSQTDKENM